MSLTDVWRTLSFIVDGVFVDQIKLSEVGQSGGFYWLTDRQSQCDFDFDSSQRNSN
jgi:hypothetical protein